MVFGTSVTFNFMSEDLHTNINGVSMNFDAGDGQGFRTVTFGTPVYVFYDDYGEVELKFRFTITGGVTINTHSILLVEPIPTRPMSNHPTDSFTVSWNNLSAKVSVKYQNNSGPSKSPFIIAEGFDPYDLIDLGINGSTTFSNFYTYNLPSYVKNNFDIYYIDWINYQADIRDNAELLKNIIRQINSGKHSLGLTGKNVLMGQSMGG